jgi:hypothetical protein
LEDATVLREQEPEEHPGGDAEPRRASAEQGFTRAMVPAPSAQ